MPSLYLTWLQFVTCLALVGLAGPLLCRSADVIADKTGLSGNWIA
jgi:cation:H+ antiporter